MFTAFTPTTSQGFSVGAYVTFQGIHLNHGNSFDKNNGKFIAPENGTYKFAFTTHLSSSGLNTFALVK